MAGRAEMRQTVILTLNHVESLGKTPVTARNG